MPTNLSVASVIALNKLASCLMKWFPVNSLKRSHDWSWFSDSPLITRDMALQCRSAHQFARTKKSGSYLIRNHCLCTCLPIQTLSYSGLQSTGIVFCGIWRMLSWRIENRTQNNQYRPLEIRFLFNRDLRNWHELSSRFVTCTSVLRSRDSDILDYFCHKLRRSLPPRCPPSCRLDDR